MPAYTALFTLTLPSPIETSATALPALHWANGGQGPLRSASLVPIVQGGRCTQLECSLHYDGPDVEHICRAGAEPSRGIQVGRPSKSGFFFLPPMDVAPLVRMILYHLSGLTMQAHVYHLLEDGLEKHVRDYRWRMPDGAVVPPIEPMYPFWALPELRDAGRRPLTPADWTSMQAMLDGKSDGAPLWMLVLAEAHRERGQDIRNVTLRCATALEVGLRPLVAGFPHHVGPLDVLRGEKGVRTPDLRSIDPILFDDAAKLWNTRHSIIHRGKAEVFHSPPDRGGAPLGPLTAEIVERFLRAVPMVMDFVQRNPP